MSFFDKLKSGLHEAGNKAKIVVEQNKLKLKNVSKESQIEKLYKEIGEKVVKLHMERKDYGLDEFKTELEAISILKLEIEQNEVAIAQLSDEKECHHCGKSNPIIARICTYCEKPFEIIEVSGEPLLIDEKAKD